METGLTLVTSFCLQELSQPLTLPFLSSSDHPGSSFLAVSLLDSFLGPLLLLSPKLTCATTTYYSPMMSYNSTVLCPYNSSPQRECFTSESSTGPLELRSQSLTSILDPPLLPLLHSTSMQSSHCLSLPIHIATTATNFYPLANAPSTFKMIL